MGGLLSEPVTAMVVESTGSEGWAASLVTMQGWRVTHEDAYIIQHVVDGPEQCGVFAVLDGHGGDTAAMAASGMLQERLVQLARRGTLDQTSAAEELQDAFIQSDARLRESLDPEDKSGTTVVAAIVTRPRPSEFCVQLAHCGDSRAVLYAGNRLTCSEDHKPARHDELKRIEAAGGCVMASPIGMGPMRVDGALAVSRALGDFKYKPSGVAPCLCKVSAVPEVQTVPGCAPGDWLFLACDGVFDVMSNEEVQDFISSRLNAVPQDAVDGGSVLVELLNLCLSRGSKDNCTACLVQLRADGVAKATSKHLLQGAWSAASQEVQEKYADFFASHGFHQEAKEVRPAAGRSHPAVQPAPEAQPQPEAIAVEASKPEEPQPATSLQILQRHLTAVAGALHAMCFARMGSWRSWRGRGDGATAAAASIKAGAETSGQATVAG